jgi:hypothetical protein
MSLKSTLRFSPETNEFVVAVDEADARAVMQEHCGHGVWGTDCEITQEPDDRMFAILGEDGAKVRKTFGEWAADNGRGYLCASVDLS